jgi:hypothetical protein
MLRNHAIVMPYHRAITNEAPGMKKSPTSSDLAARIEAAAKQPAGAGKVPRAVLVSPTPAEKPPVLGDQAQPSAPMPAKLKKTKPKEPDTVPITLRPSTELLNKYVLKAAERTREEGRVISAQQIMIEALERSVP